MNKQNKLRYTELFIKDKLNKYPSFKDRIDCIPAPNLKEAGANDLTRLVVEFIQLNGYQAERISSQGQYRDGKKQVTDVIGRVRTIGSGTWTKGSSTPGTADISSTILGKSVKIEIKYGNDRQSGVQKEYQSNIERAGGVYIIVKTFDDFVLWFDSFL